MLAYRCKRRLVRPSAPHLTEERARAVLKTGHPIGLTCAEHFASEDLGTYSA